MLTHFLRGTFGCRLYVWTTYWFQIIHLDIPISQQWRICAKLTVSYFSKVHAKHFLVETQDEGVSDSMKQLNRNHPTYPHCPGCAGWITSDCRCFMNRKYEGDEPPKDSYEGSYKPRPTTKSSYEPTPNPGTYEPTTAKGYMSLLTPKGGYAPKTKSSYEPSTSKWKHSSKDRH